MIKYCCDKCGKELTKEERQKCTIKVSGYSGITDTYETDYCEGCLALIIGADNYEKMKWVKAERYKRKKEREQARAMEGGD